MTGPRVDVALGLDGGGTQTRVAAATTEGVIRGRGWAGACNLAAVPPPEALAAALAAILRAADGTGEPTSLSRHVLSALGLSALTDIIPGVYGGSLSRVAIAGLSRAVAEAALTDNDAVARTILMRASGALAHLTHGVTQRLFADADAPFPVVSIGGLWNAGGLLTDVFTRSLRRFAPTAILTPPLHSPVEGAVLRAVTLRADA